MSLSKITSGERKALFIGIIAGMLSKLSQKALGLGLPYAFLDLLARILLLAVIVAVVVLMAKMIFGKNKIMTVAMIFIIILAIMINYFILTEWIINVISNFLQLGGAP